MNHREWILKRNCSLTPRQLALAYAVLCMMSFAVATGFVALHGAWYVLAYAVLEMALIALAFVCYARHASDQEHIALSDGCLLIDRIEAGRVRQTRLDPSWTRIALPRYARDLIRLEAQGVRIEVGRFVTDAKRRQFAQELRQALGSSLLASTGVRA